MNAPWRLRAVIVNYCTGTEKRSQQLSVVGQESFAPPLPHDIPGYSTPRSISLIISIEDTYCRWPQKVKMYLTFTIRLICSLRTCAHYRARAAETNTPDSARVKSSLCLFKHVQSFFVALLQPLLRTGRNGTERNGTGQRKNGIEII